MTDFSLTLELINLINSKEKREKHTSLWEGESTQLSGISQIHQVFQVRRFANSAQLNDEAKKLNSNFQIAIISSNENPARIEQNLTDIGFQSVRLERTILHTYLMNRTPRQTRLYTPNVFIEPIITDVALENDGRGTQIIRNWLNNPGRGSAGIVTAPAGFGKTTFCQHLCNIIKDSDDAFRIPIYISSEDWSTLISKGSIAVNDIFLNATSRDFQSTAIGIDLIEHLISRGAILPVFDGLDELCMDAYTEVSVSDIVEQIALLFDSESEGKVIFTSRSTFWSDSRASDRHQFVQFEVKPFDNHQKARYIKEFLDDDKKIKTANTILESVDRFGSQNPSIVSHDSIRFSSSPYIIHLACLGAENDELGFERDANFNPIDPLDAIFSALVYREHDKVRVHEREQINILLSLALLYSDSFSLDQMKSVISLYTLSSSEYHAMFSHHLIASYGNHRTFLFRGLSDYLRAKGFCHWLFREDDEIVGIEEYMSEIRAEGDTSVDIFGEISNFYRDRAGIIREFSSKRASSVRSKLGFQGQIFLLMAALRRHHHLEKSDTKSILLDVFCDSKPEFQGILFEGILENLNFTGFEFKKCHFKNCVFRECLFDSSTMFINCTFDDELDVVRCPSFGEVGSVLI